MQTEDSVKTSVNIYQGTNGCTKSDEEDPELMMETHFPENGERKPRKETPIQQYPGYHTIESDVNSIIVCYRKY